MSEATSKKTLDLPSSIGEYHIVQEIGRGAMGSIFLARDTLLEREVALKLIAADDLDTDAKTLFFHEARALARVSHPNVVAVYRVGDAEGKPYLVTELVQGISLEDLAKPISWQRAVSLGVGIARGLAAAHRKKVLHRDIKPANVMLSHEDEPKLVDFGLAKVLEDPDAAIRPVQTNVIGGPKWSRVSKSGEIAGTPLYMAPEALFGKPATAQSDIYGVGALLYELVAGIAPRDSLPEDVPLEAWISTTPRSIEDLARTAINPRFSAIISRCLSASPTDRFSTSEALADALEALRDDDDTVEAPAGNPYRGLEPFELEHRGVFFGREAEIRAVSGRLRADPIVVVAGDSGVGKSSLCKAGVLPNLTRESLDKGRKLRIIGLVPGRFPLQALTHALAGVLSTADFETSTSPDADQAALYRKILRGLGENEDLLLFIDQFEELCTSSDNAEAESFTAALLRASTGPRVRVLATLRGDFITQLARFGGIGPILAKSLFLLRPMNEEAIRAAIVKPALRKGVTFESEELVDELVRASAEMPGGLPLLEFALAEIWEARETNSTTLTKHVLRSIGSVSGALARHADAVLDGLSAEEKRAARRVLLKLTHTNRTRARRTWRELGGGEPETRAALDALVRGRLIVAKKGGDEEAVYEVAHEALLREWQTLREWLEETREQGQFLQELEEAAELWARRGRREDETWAGDALAQAMYRVQHWALDLPSVSREFLNVGVMRQQGAARRRRWIIGGTGATLVAIAVISTIAAIAFAEKEQKARLAAADMGEINLTLELFDWDAKEQKSTRAAPPATLDWRLYSVSANDVNAPGAPFDAEQLRRSGRRLDENALHEHVEARSGPAFLEVFGRGNGCGSSFLYMRRLPGYTERVTQGPIEIKIAVPSCRATMEDTVEIPAGEFYRARPKGEKTSEWIDSIDSLPAFRIDRNEVTQGAFAHYAAMEKLTGDSVVRTAYLDLERKGSERLPVVGIDSFLAARYCHFIGKELPSVDQWLKAMRGGTRLPNGLNPSPQRNRPWLDTSLKNAANLIDPGDGFDNLAPIGSFPEDVSPYGIVDLAGNAREWTKDNVELRGMLGLRYVLGAAWDTPPEHAHWGNMRPARFLDFTVGIRCIVP